MKSANVYQGDGKQSSINYNPTFKEFTIKLGFHTHTYTYICIFFHYVYVCIHIYGVCVYVRVMKENHTMQ